MYLCNSSGSNSKTSVRSAFSLVELIVVIGIIGILSAVLIASFSGSTESARAAKCLSNMRNLATAWNSGCAGSSEVLSMGLKQNGVKLKYSEAKGWISSATEGLYPGESHQSFNPISMFETKKELVDYAFTNGWMYSALKGDRSTYVCPTHQKKLTAKNSTVNWSYFMNSAFGWDNGSKTYVNCSSYIEKSSMVNAERKLIFAEIPFQGAGDWFPDANGSGTETDAILQCGSSVLDSSSSSGDGSQGANESLSSSGIDENIGGNHKSGKEWYAHVAFADGHVEKFRVTNITSEELKKLTAWLCEGKSVGRNGSSYEEIK